MTSKQIRLFWLGLFIGLVFGSVTMYALVTAPTVCVIPGGV